MVPNFSILSTFHVLIVVYFFAVKFEVQCDEYLELTKQPYFVDKSLLLERYFTREKEALIAEKQKNYEDISEILNYYYVNSPRGFGKTTILNMIRKFAEFEPSGENFTLKPYHRTKASDVFCKLKIYNHKKIVSAHMSQYGVIYLDLNFEPDELVSEEVAEKAFVAKMGKSFETCQWLGYFEGTSRAVNTVRDTVTGRIQSIHVYRALYYMAKLMDKFNPKGIILLVDNFDSAARISVQRPNLAVKFVYNLIYKTIDKLLEINVSPPGFDDFRKRCLCLVTGVTRLYFESINFKSHSYFRSAPFMTRGFFSPFFGFEQSDVDGLLARYNCTDREKTDVANYYRGYTAEDSVSFLYNPVSVVQYLISKQTFDGVGQFEPYWARNESVDFIVDFAKAAKFRAKLQELCTKNTFKVESPFKNVDPDMFISFLESSQRNYEDMLDEDVPALLYYFYEHGFLKHASKFVWHSFAFATFELKTEVRRKLEERGLKFK